MSAVQRDVSVKRPYARCMVTGEDIIRDLMVSKRSSKETTTVRNISMVFSKKVL